MRWAAVFLLAGCLTRPPRPDEASGPACTTPTIRDTFDDPFAPVCGVGFQDGNGDSTIERGGGVLRQAPGAGVINDASCTWASFDFDQGTFVQLLKPLRTGGTYTILQAEVGGAAVGIEVLDDSGPVLLMFDTAQDDLIVELDYDKDMEWLRLRPDGGQITGEYSQNGEDWVFLGTSAVTPAPTTEVSVSLNAGIYNPLADPGVAEFDNFNVCP